LTVTLSGREHAYRRLFGSVFGFKTFGRLLAGSEARRAWAWVTGLVVLSADERLVADLAGSPEVANGVALTIDRLGSGGAAVLAESQHVARLRVLILNRCRIGPDGAIALSVAPQLAGLTELHLRHARVGDRGARAIAESPFLENLQVLKLNHNEIGEPGG